MPSLLFASVANGFTTPKTQSIKLVEELAGLYVKATAQDNILILNIFQTEIATERDVKLLTDLAKN